MTLAPARPETISDSTLPPRAGPPRGALAGAGLAALLLAATPVRAADPVPPDSASPSVLPDIVVTAQKRNETLQEAPLSLSVLSAETLREEGAQGFTDVAARIPGVAFNSAGPGRSSYSVRGIASIGGNAPTTGFYVDETPIVPSGGDGATATIDPDLFDLARVEVLRGPQGTLYGASSMGGTIRLITTQPKINTTESSFRAEGSDTQGGGANGRIDAMVNVPVVDNAAALRMVATYKRLSGFIDREIGVWAPNTNPPGSPAFPVSPASPTAVIRGVNTEERLGMRAALRIAPNENLAVTPALWYQQVTLGAPSDFDTPTGTTGGALVQARPFNVAEPSHDHFLMGTLTVNYELGFGNLVSSTSFIHRTLRTTEDQTEALEINLPQGQFLPSAYAPLVTTREFTQELRLSIAPAGSPLSGIVGAYFNNTNRHYDVNYVVPGYNALFANSPASLQLFGPGPLNDVNYSQNGDYAPKQKALFAEFNEKLTSKLTATAGLRWYQLQYTTVRNEDGLSNGGPTVSTGQAKNSGFNPKASLAYQIDPDALAYATVAKGVRPGGVNTDNLAAKGCGQDYGPYQPDSLWSYELGSKTRWLGGALTADGAVYFMRWSGTQQGETLPCSYQITQNAGAADVQGAELELEAQLGRHLLLTGGVGYTKATLAEDAPNLGGVKGQQLQNVPLVNLNVGARYAFVLTSSVRGFARVDAQHVGQSYPDFARTDPATFQRAYTLVDLRGGAIAGPWETNVFLNNLFNTRAYLSRFISDNYDASSRSRMFTNRPRTLGVSLQRSF
jgi:outer membrane receptor protein involved in Fe transport